MWKQAIGQCDFSLKPEFKSGTTEVKVINHVFIVNKTPLHIFIFWFKILKMSSNLRNVSNGFINFLFML